MPEHKSVTLRVPSDAERRRGELFMKAERFVRFARGLRLECSEVLLETYERKKAMFPHARIVRPKRLEQRQHLHTRAHRSDPFSTSDRQHVPYIEFDNEHWAVASGLYSEERVELIASDGHPISRSLSGDLAPGVLQRPEKRRFHSWDDWQLEFADGMRGDRATHFYGWWQVLSLYDLEYVNLRVENPAWDDTSKRSEPESHKRIRKMTRWVCLHRDVNAPARVDFDSVRAPLDGLWPSAWTGWYPWIERAADFDWRSHASLQWYWQTAGSSGSQEEWHLHKARERVAATRLTEGTSYEEWTQLLRALCRFEEHLAKQERLLLRSVVYDVVRLVADLLMVAFNKSVRELAADHDGWSREATYDHCVVDGDVVRPWHLLEVLNERLFMTDRYVRPLVEHHFDQLRGRLASPLSDDVAVSLLDTLATVYNEPLLSALASYQRIESREKGSPWSNQRTWAAIRALVVATESETRRWFGKDSLFEVFDAVFGCNWQTRWQRFGAQHPDLKDPASTDTFLDALEVLVTNVSARGEERIQHLDHHVLVAYLARNWNAHCGQDPHPYAAHLGHYVVSSLLTTLLVVWDEARRTRAEQLATIYPSTACDK